MPTIRKDQPLKVAILWHMHQPNYREPNSNRLSMPWVRLHALKDYLDMPLLAGSFEQVKVTFNLVPSLIDQIDLYLSGATDRHFELSRMHAEELPPQVKIEILETFFSANPTTMIKPFPRYWELYNKAKQGDGNKGVIASVFSSAEIRDLQVWSNLAWVDPLFHAEPVIKSLLAKGKQFTEEEKSEFLDWQLELIGRIIPTYKELFLAGKIDVSFTPYYHPILPLLCDTDVATEALPGIKLPERRFQHPEDADQQVAMAARLFEETFGKPMAGMWPSEGSVSEAALSLLLKNNIQWAATDEEVLYHSLLKSHQDRAHHPVHAVYEFGPGLKLFFRDHGLSDRIGFVYSGWSAERAVQDFVSHLHEIRKHNIDRLHEAVVPVILDGENAWEYFPNDGHQFLTQFYTALQEDPFIETITMTEAARTLPAKPLHSIFAGSWINHSFRIWIGHQEDNQAWDLLSQTRDTLVRFQKDNPHFDRARIDAAWNQIYVAEGSDWCWWYGDDHRSVFREQFDRTYRRHLAAVYEYLQLEVPRAFAQPIVRDISTSPLLLPENTISPMIDGRMTNFYEWTGAGLYDSLKAGGSMHHTTRYISALHFGYDLTNVYIRLDFHNRMGIDLLDQPRFIVELKTPDLLRLELAREGEAFRAERAGSFVYALEDILEVAISRDLIWPDGFGALDLTMFLYEGAEKIESPSGDEPLRISVPQRNKELFWPI